MIAVRHHPVELELRHTFRLARGASDSRRNLVVEIEHDGEIYRLRHTRRGKLILTK